MLNKLDDLLRIACRHAPELLDPVNWGVDPLSWCKSVVRDGSLYCPKCNGTREMAIKTASLWPEPVRHGALRPGAFTGLGSGPTGPSTAATTPAQLRKSLKYGLFEFKCVQCDVQFTALIYEGPRGLSLAVFPTCYGGLATPTTPEGVRFYLDQAQRAQSVGANSAAVAMYRAALEHLLFEQGYKRGTCGTKLEELRTAVEKGEGPVWASGIDGQSMKVLKDLGDGAIHPNDGNITRQASLDERVLAAIQATFARLLDVVYEKPHEERERLEVLKQARDELQT